MMGHVKDMNSVFLLCGGPVLTVVLLLLFLSGDRP